MSSIYLGRNLLFALLAGTSVFGQDVKRGGALYLSSTCHACHGDKGDGKGIVAVESKPVLKPLPASFKGGFKYGSDLQSIIKSIRHGIPGTKMISYKGILTDEEIADIARYIQSFQQKKNGDK